MLFVYPAVFHKESGSVWVEFPDLPGCQSYGETVEEAFEMAQEALEVYIVTLLEQGKDLEKASEIKNIAYDNNSFVSLVSCNISDFTKETKSVKKTLTIPQWLNDKAITEHINFSKTLQEALIEQLNIR